MSDLEKEIFSLVEEEVRRGWIENGGFRSRHEGYAVILEELDELWDLIKANGSASELRKEAVQIAAMAISFAMECS